MAAHKVTDEEFISLFRERGATDTAQFLGITERNVYLRRRNIEKRSGQLIGSPTKPTKPQPQRQHLTVTDGIVIVASDFHYWPGPPSTMHRALLHFCKEMRPAAFIANGDVLDFPKISAHKSIGWEKHPEVIEEIETAQDRLHEIAMAVPMGCRLIWTLGNHDARYESKIANELPQYAKVPGVHLSDHYPIWEKAYSVWINDNVVIKHRIGNGIHATHTNTVKAGKTVITGHLHSAKVTPYTDYNGTRYGVDTGCIADAEHPAFLYCEDNPVNWRSAFCVLTFKDGRLLQPELVLKFADDAVEFRGEIIKV